MLLAILNYIFKKPFSHNTQPMHKTMETKPKTSEVEVIVFPYPIQGHINPMLQFSKQLASRGLKITLVTTSTFSNTNFQSTSITLETIPDGSDHTAKNDPKNIDAFIERFDSVAPQSLTQLIERKLGSKNGNVVRCLVYDSAFPWALDIAKKFGIYGASFFTQNCLVNFIYNQVYLGLLKIPIEGSLDCYDGMPLVEAESLPSFVRVVGGFPVLEKLVFDQFSNCKDADWCFINSFDALDNKVISSTSNEWVGTTIGPCIPSMYLDKRLENDRNYGLSLFEPQTDACIQWLNAQEPDSVVYVSMGSIASLDGAQMKEIAKGLEISNKYFLWVVRPSEQNKLPSNFKENTSDKGLIVNWCPQLEVLAHDAIGCFVTHCGWNSTLEAVCLGVPIVAFPQWTDQPTNAKCIVDFWNVGVRVKVEENGFLCGDELCACIQEVMEGEGANKIKNNANMWKKLSIQAMEKGGSSDKNIDEFIAKLL